jgi:hypothetical protein
MTETEGAEEGNSNNNDTTKDDDDEESRDSYSSFDIDDVISQIRLEAGKPMITKCPNLQLGAKRVPSR